MTDTGILLDKERVGRVPGRPPGIIKIESTDKSIDRLVYELSRTGIIYGLPEEEIKIMEGR